MRQALANIKPHLKLESCIPPPEIQALLGSLLNCALGAIKADFGRYRRRLFDDSSEADQAADELEREMQLELAGSAAEVKPNISTVEVKSASPAPGSAATPASTEELITAPVVDKGKGRDEAWRRGLAGLPKKPTF